MICSYLCPVDPHFDWGREICRLLRSFSFSCLTFSPSQWELFDYIDPRCGSLLLILNLHLMTWMRPGWSCSSLELLMLVSAAPTRPGPALGGHRIPLPPSLRLEPPSPLEPAAAFSDILYHWVITSVIIFLVRDFLRPSSPLFSPLPSTKPVLFIPGPGSQNQMFGLASVHNG